MTLYALLLQACGLSHREAADFHGNRLDTIKSRASSRIEPPEGAVAELRALYDKIERAADELLDMIERAPDGAEIELGYPADDHEARSLGWPCVGAWRAVAARVIASTDRPVRLVPRGDRKSVV